MGRSEVRKWQAEVAAGELRTGSRRADAGRAYQGSGEVLRPAILPHEHAAGPSGASVATPYQQVFELAPVAFALVDQRLRVVGVNKRFRVLAGVSGPGAEGQFMHELFPVGESDLTAAVTTAARGLPGVMTTVLLRLGDPEVAVMASCLTIHGDATEAHVLIVLREVDDQGGAAGGQDAGGEAPHAADALAPDDDVATAGPERPDGPVAPGEITGRQAPVPTPHRAAVQNARARERRLAAVGQLSAGVMHDVNNALNPIVAAAYLLDMHADDPAMVRHYAARIAAAAETGAATAARVGRFLRQEPLEDAEHRLVDLAAIADEVVAMTRPLWAERAAGGRVSLHRELVPDVRIRAVAGEIREALLNLVYNALDAMEGGGMLTVRTYHDGDSAVVEVQDNGIGMPPEIADQAFDPFFTTKGTRGSGLGLAEVFGIMRRHGGLPSLHSSPRLGTLVRLSFPAAADLPDKPPVTRTSGARRRLLVVEDNPDSREFLRAILVAEGHTVDVAAGVADALAFLRQRQGSSNAVDTVVTDVGLLDGSGWELVGAVRAHWPSLTIGIVTGWDATEDQEGDVDFLLRKPIRTDSLLAAVAK